MKTLDKVIIKTVIAILILLSIGYFQQAIYVVGWLMAVVSAIFVGCHVALFAPTVALLLLWTAICHNILYSRIILYSKILAYFFGFIFVILGYFLTLFIWTYLMYMCLEYKINFSDYLSFVEMIGNL